MVPNTKRDEKHSMKPTCHRCSGVMAWHESMQQQHLKALQQDAGLLCAGKGQHPPGDPAVDASGQVLLLAQASHLGRTMNVAATAQAGKAGLGRPARLAPGQRVLTRVMMVRISASSSTSCETSLA